MIVPRSVTKCLDEQLNAPEEKHFPLESLREHAAWVLLGEPGAGKSKAFEIEAQLTEGVFISIAEFLSDDPPPAWREKALYLDGLDETRASGGEISVLLKLKASLKKLGKPKFRIACRAADWFGSMDAQVIGEISQDGQLGVYVLEPLSLANIQDILRENYAISAPENFIENARIRGIEGLLDNPQTLSLLAEAIRDGEWPRTRLEAFQLACNKLADEDSKRHRVYARTNPIPVEEVLSTAGQLCAVLLLSDKSGIALDKASSDDNFPLLDDFSPSQFAFAKIVTGRKLFRPAPNTQERIIPSHRSIAEFLAAKWLAERIDSHGLPLGRALNLFFGLDERTVAGLRGLYAWLAWHSRVARQRLIDADPLTVITYGDVKSMSIKEKRRLLQGLCREAKIQIYYRWERASANQLGALAEKQLADDFAHFLNVTDRDDASQSMAACVLDILCAAELIPELMQTIKAVVLDEAWWLAIRRRALELWLKYPGVDDEAKSLLEALALEREMYTNDELIGLLLTNLYPKKISADKLFGFLRSPAEGHVIGGSYPMFWGYTLPRVAPKSDLLILLDQLADPPTLAITDEMEFSFDWHRMSGALLCRGLQVHGDEISDERLYSWLGVGADSYGNYRRESEHQGMIVEWLAARPGRYKSIIELSYKYCESSGNIASCLLEQESRLHGAPSPDDIGLWHLQLASHEQDDKMAEQHLLEAARALILGQGAIDLSLEKFEAWGDANQMRRHWLDSLFASEIPDWRTQQAAKSQKRKLEKDARKREKTTILMEHLEAIRQGLALPRIMHELAGVWLDRYSDTHGDNVRERFDSYCNSGNEVLVAAEAGFFHCPEANGLPSVEEIVKLSIEQHEHLIRNPCLVGMELRWRADKSFVNCLTADQLQRMLAFRLTYGAENEPAWFSHLVLTQPEVVADVLIVYASISLKSKKEFVYGLYALANNDSYRRVAELATIPLLQSFPRNINSSGLSHLEHLLKAALRYIPKQLNALIQPKLALKTMDVPQRVYWLTVGTLVNPQQYESLLCEYIGRSWIRAKHLCEFVSDRFRGLVNEYELPVATLGRLIESLAPHAELERHSGLVTGPMQIGENIHVLVTRLGSIASQEAADEIERLLGIPALRKLKYALSNTKHQLKLKQREDAFRFPALKSVASVLANREPSDVSDLAALTLDFINDISYEIRHDNDDVFRAFWNVEKKKPTSMREENLCRDVLLQRLRQRFAPFGVDCQPEGDYANDKRADIRLSYRNNFELPIEIKREDNRELWRAAKEQLMTQYASSPKASGYGIYLVLWFGRAGFPPAHDGEEKPDSPEDLCRRLEARLDYQELKRIFVRVLDVSWPAAI